MRVGGPATSSAHWVDSFLKHVAAQNVPIDFVSSHGYADDTVKDLFGTDQGIPPDMPMDERVCAAIHKVHDQIAASPRPRLPLFWTEWNVPSFGLLHAHDTFYVGAALADDIRQCDGLVDMMSFWTFSDVFEEDGPKREPFDGGFGLMAMRGIKKPSYAAFALLHQLGRERIPLNVSDVLVTRRADNTLAIAAWNLVDPDQKGTARTIKLKIHGAQPNASVTITRVDADHANTLATYQKMGHPRYPTEAQVSKLNAMAESNSPRNIQLHDGELDLQIPVDGLALLEVSTGK